MMRASPPISSLAALAAGKEDGHVDVVQVEDRQDLSASGDHFSVARELVLHPSGSRRDENQIVQDRTRFARPRPAHS